MKKSKEQSRNQLMHNLKERIKPKLKWYNILGHSMSALFGILIGILWFTSLDIQAATSFDFNQLEKQAIKVTELSDLININSEITITDYNVIVEFSNTECSINVEYDKDFEILSIDRYDESNGIFYALLSTLGWFMLIFLLFGKFFSDLFLDCSKVLILVYKKIKLFLKK